MNKLFWITLACGVCAGCNEKTPISGLNPAATGAEDDGGARHKGYFAALSSNFMGATSISLLGRDGDVVGAEWVGSKTENPDLRTPLAQDVVLPTVPYARRYLTTLERDLGVVTRFDLDTGKVLGQLKTDESPQEDEAAYHSNPQDVYYANDKSGWVSRWAPNLDPSADTREGGDDLIEFDPATMKRTARRIDLSKLDVEIEEQQFDKDMNSTTVMSTAYARPAALVPANGYLVVGLVRMTAAYNYAEGALAVVDEVSGKLVHDLTLNGLANCGNLKPLLDDTTQVLVECIGAYGDEGAKSGIIRVQIDKQGKASVVERFAAADNVDAANATSNVLSLADHQVVAVAYGELDTKTNAVKKRDAAYLVDIATGKQTQLVESDGAFALGVPAFDAKSGVLLIPDAGSSDKPLFGAHRFHSVGDGTYEAAGFVEIAPDTGLAAREIHHL
jgi:hypothetical protein